MDPRARRGSARIGFARNFNVLEGGFDDVGSPAIRPRTLATVGAVLADAQVALRQEIGRSAVQLCPGHWTHLTILRDPGPFLEGDEPGLLRYSCSEVDCID